MRGSEFGLAIGLALWATVAQGEPLECTIDADAPGIPISPLIYGSNHDIDGLLITAARRFGGNRLSAYNWEIDASNAGADHLNMSDRWLLEGLLPLWWIRTSDKPPASGDDVPGATMRYFIEESGERRSYSLISVPIGPYVVADADGPITETERAPSPRWLELDIASTDGTRTDPADDRVYLFEQARWLSDNCRAAGVELGVGLDNEPGLWHETHPRAYTAPVGAREVVERSRTAARTIRAAAPEAEIFGPGSWGVVGMSHLNDASGWRESDEATHHPSFLGYYLEEMSRDAHEAGPPLLDVLDVHWYAESETIENGGPRAIIHAPRSLYDEAYQEPTWIGTWFAHELPVLHRLKSLAAEYAPGTRIAITEYDFRLGGQIYGGLAQVDALGAFGREGVYLAGYHAHAEDAPTEYIRAAFELFLDCEGVAFGDLSLPVAGPDSEDCVVYAARASASGRVHVIALNRSLEEPLDLRIRCERPRSLEPIRAWSLDRSGPIVRRGALPVPRTGGAVHATMPALSAWHFVFETRDPADDVRE